ncbi:hypothetical protein [Coralloluteibacterium thermophilus]|uniref:DUF4097 domain-containing protein n=1 Tax=Coralloluteibacterium thermophilum TaxID=2707049 RepID=A0ABV9NJS6_9GAMM
MRAAVLVPLAAALLAPAIAQADVASVFTRSCAHEARRDLQLDLDGIRTLVVDVGPHTVHVEGGGDGAVEGRACAAREADLDGLRLLQEREGDRLVLRAVRDEGRTVIRLFGSSYALLEARVRVPAGMEVDMRVGSGDGLLAGVAAGRTTVGSGDARAERIAGAFAATVGSGDLEIRDIGSLDIGAVGSGDVEADGVRGTARIGSVGSGDVALREVDGDVSVGTIGSGDVALRNVGGSVTVDNIGSGDLDVDGVRGDLRVRNVGSGDIEHRGVAGTVDIPRRR